MAATLKIKNSSIPTTAPSGLTAGEMAINLADKKLYVGGTAGTNVIFLDSTSSVGLGTANTFTALQTFSAGISASGATFSKDININGVAAGIGAGTANTKFGKDAQSQMEAGGGFCSAFGYQAGYWNSTGDGNSSFGYNALLNTRTGSWNTGLGINSLYTNQSGSHNVSCGLESLYSQTSDNSVGIGSNAGYSINSNNVVAIGFAAAKFQSDGTTALTGGSSSVYIGSQCRGLNNSDSNSIVIGAAAIGFGVNTTVIGTSSTTSANIYGVLNLPSGLSAAGATFTGPIISTGYQISSGAINAQTASYSLVAGDNGKIVTMNVASANNLTVPASLAVGFNCTVIQLGAGQTTILASGTTLNSYQSYLKISGQHGSASIVGYTSNVYNVAGNLSA